MKEQKKVCEKTTQENVVINSYVYVLKISYKTSRTTRFQEIFLMIQKCFKVVKV